MSFDRRFLIGQRMNVRIKCDDLQPTSHIPLVDSGELSISYQSVASFAEFSRDFEHCVKHLVGFWTTNINNKKIKSVVKCYSHSPFFQHHNTNLIVVK